MKFFKNVEKEKRLKHAKSSGARSVYTLRYAAYVKPIYVVYRNLGLQVLAPGIPPEPDRLRAFHERAQTAHDLRHTKLKRASLSGHWRRTPAPRSLFTTYIGFTYAAYRKACARPMARGL